MQGHLLIECIESLFFLYASFDCGPMTLPEIKCQPKPPSLIIRRTHQMASRIMIRAAPQLNSAAGQLKTQLNSTLEQHFLSTAIHSLLLITYYWSHKMLHSQNASLSITFYWSYKTLACLFLWFKMRLILTLHVTNCRLGLTPYNMMDVRTWPFNV